MYNQTRVTLKNAVETFENILKDMQTDLEKYENNPKYIEKVGFFKRMQIHNLQSVCTVFSEFGQDANNEIEDLTKTIGGLKTDNTKYQACCLYYGITGSEIERFLNMKTTEAVAHVKFAYAHNWRQLPLNYCNTIPTLKPLMH